jgi:hypothetical protein
MAPTRGVIASGRPIVSRPAAFAGEPAGGDELPVFLRRTATIC